MSEILLSPGVSARENDQSFIQGQPTEVGAAIIGPTAKGPVEIPTLVGSFGEFAEIFGGSIESGSNVYSYFTGISANNYFQNGGNSLLVTRVTSGSFTPATSSLIPTASAGNPGAGLSPFILETLSEGEIMNSTSPFNQYTGTFSSGSKDNIKFEIASPNINNGTFSLLVRRGDDNNNQKVVLEQYNNLSLDPYASNYISKVIGDTSKTPTSDGTDHFIQETGTYPNASRYVRVKQVNFNTPNYFDNNGTPKNQFTGSIPQVSTGSFGSAVGSNIPTGRPAKFYQDATGSADVQGLVGNDYNTAISLMSNVDEYKYNVITVPGLNRTDQQTQLNNLVNNSISRGDSLSIIDLVGYGSMVSHATTAASGYDNSYAATYWPWLQTIDPNTGNLVFVPASTMIPGVFAFTDASSDPWFAPAGITRGGLGQVVKAERKLTAGNRDTLYDANINPIATFPSQGVVVFGQKTLQKRASALDRINVRRLLIALKGYISQISDNLVFEQNTNTTRNSFLSQVNPYLESVQQRQGLFAFKVVMDDTNNTPDVIDRNELVGQIFIQPTKTAEFIMLDFNVLPTGATFPA